MAVTSAIILAGGLGTRLRSAVPDLPKPLAPINGRPFLEYQLDYWLGQGIRRFILSVGYKHELIQQHFGNAYRGAEIDYAVETEPLGTGGGLLLAAGRIRAPGPWLVLNGDTFLEVQAEELAAFHQRHDADVTLSLFEVVQNTRYTGVDVDEAGRVTRLQSEATGQRQLINGGVYLFGEAGLAMLSYRPGERVSLETEILESMLRGGRRVFGCAAHGRFIDIGIPDDYARAAALFVHG